MRKECCKNCRYWQPWPPRDGETESKVGDCYVNPPVPSHQRGERPVRPWVYRDDECGEFVAGENRKRAQQKAAVHQGGGNYGVKDEIPF